MYGDLDPTGDPENQSKISRRPVVKNADEDVDGTWRFPGLVNGVNANAPCSLVAPNSAFYNNNE